MALGIESPLKDLGPCALIWDPDSANLEMKPTLGTVTFKSELMYSEIKEDGHGQAPVDAVHTGRIVTIEAPFTRITLAKLNVLVQGSATGASYLTVPNKCGGNTYDDAKQVIIKPLVDDVASIIPAEWVIFWKAMPFEAWEIGYDLEGQRVFQTKFLIYPDDNSGNVGELFQIGA